MTKVKPSNWRPEGFDLKLGMSTQLSLTEAFERGCFVFCSHKRYRKTSETSRTFHGMEWLFFIHFCSNTSQERGSGKDVHVNHVGHSKKSDWKHAAGYPRFSSKKKKEEIKALKLYKKSLNVLLILLKKPKEERNHCIKVSFMITNYLATSYISFSFYTVSN